MVARDFVIAWQICGNYAEVAKKLKVKPNAVRTMHYNLKKRGVNLRQAPCGWDRRKLDIAELNRLAEETYKEEGK